MELDCFAEFEEALDNDDNDDNDSSTMVVIILRIMIMLMITVMNIHISYIYIYIYVHLSLSLYIYIYIYTHIVCGGPPSECSVAIMFPARDPPEGISFSNSLKHTELMYFVRGPYLIWGESSGLKAAWQVSVTFTLKHCMHVYVCMYIHTHMYTCITYAYRYL